MIVATPNRLWDTMQSGHAHVHGATARSPSTSSRHRPGMVERGHFAELTSIIQNIPQPPRIKRPGGAAKLTSEERAAAVDAFVDADADEEEKRKVARGPKQMLDRQTFVFSATLTVPDSVRRKLKKGKAPTVARAAGARPQSGLVGISHGGNVPFLGRVKMVDGRR